MAAAMVASDLMEQGRLGAALPYLEEARLSAQERPPGIPHEIGPAVGGDRGHHRWILGERESRPGRGGGGGAARRSRSACRAGRSPAHSCAPTRRGGRCSPTSRRPPRRTPRGPLLRPPSTGSGAGLRRHHARGGGAGTAGGPEEAAGPRSRSTRCSRPGGRRARKRFVPSSFAGWRRPARPAGSTEGALTAVREGLDHVRRFGGHMHEPELHRFEGLFVGGRRRAGGRGRRAAAAARVAGDLGALNFDRAGAGRSGRVRKGQRDGPG